MPADQVRRRLHAPARRGEWVTPAHGLWLPVSPEYRTWGAPPGIEIVDILMHHFNASYYVGWLSAAQLHGAAHQAPQVFQVATGRHVRSRDVGRTRFRFVTRAAAGRLPVVDRPTRSGSARLAAPATTMLDLAADLVLAGGLDNAATVIVELSDAESFDAGALADLAPAFPAAAGRRVGWILETFGESTDLEPLRTAALAGPTSPSVLDPTGPTRSTLNPRWNLRINRTVEPDL